ncbi:MAG TPA: hypothetical protein VJZ26_17810 [Blastocatellia bacterium]|nr:hypothetical protein [Blastocatellia bacterium]
MKTANRLLTWVALALFLFFPTATPAQWNKKPYTEWSEKDVQKLLEDSPWSQNQIFTDTSKAASTTNSRGSTQTAIADVINVNFHIRFFTAKPVRQAISRFMQLQQKGEMSDQMAARLKSLAAADFPDYIIVTVTCDGDRASNMLQDARALLQKLVTANIKNNTYLLTKAGQRVFLQEYQPPRNDGLGARFVFPRLVDGKPFVTPDGGEILFHAELGGGSQLNSTLSNSDVARNGFTLNMRYKIKDMMFDGKLEY